jgi:hypothetical protein
LVANSLQTVNVAILVVQCSDLLGQRLRRARRARPGGVPVDEAQHCDFRVRNVQLSSDLGLELVNVTRHLRELILIPDLQVTLHPLPHRIAALGVHGPLPVHRVVVVSLLEQCTRNLELLQVCLISGNLQIS